MSKKSSIKNIIGVVCLFSSLPLVVILTNILGVSMHLPISLMVAFLSILSLFLSFETRKPQAKEIVVLAVMCAIAVMGRAVFAFIPFFKPIGAIVILTAVTMGAQCGFLCGAISILASNFLFGQGPWTPWQMIGFGLLGFFAGILFFNKENRITKINLILYATITYMFFIGPLLDISGFLFLTNIANTTTLVPLLVAGIPVNIAQCVATGLFLMLLTTPFLEKLNRMKTKYGIMENR